MTTPFRLDHAVILVNDLQQAIADYQSLRFNVFFGGTHSDGKTHNALIICGDGSYIELLAPTDPSLIRNADPNDQSSFLFMFTRGEGFGGYALLSQNLDLDVEAMQQRGLSVHRRPPGGRARPDGQALHWRSAMLEGSMTPFFIQDDTPRRLRVPDDRDKTQHPNGVTGIAGILIAVHELNAGVNRYRAILGEEPQQYDETTADFTLNQWTITLAAPTPEDQDLSEYLTHYGEAPYKLWLWTDQANQDGQLDARRTHGVFIELMR